MTMMLITSLTLTFCEIDELWLPGEKCLPVQPTSCAVVYDSHDCYGGWSLNISDGDHLRFRYFSSSWSYRYMMTKYFKLWPL